MKRIVLLAAVAVLALSLCACGAKTSSFSIEGTWKSTGEGSFGQVQPGAIVSFDGKNCNVLSPGDTYAFNSKTGLTS